MKKLLLSMLYTAFVGGLVLADGLSATVELPVTPSFGIRGDLNYSLTVLDNAVVGVRVSPGYSFASQTFTIESRLGGAYVVRLAESSNGYVEAAARAGANFDFSTGVVWSFDVGAELFAAQRLASNIVGYADVILTLPVAPNFASGTDLYANAGLKFELAREWDAYADFAIDYVFGAPGVSYDITGAIYYNFAPEFRAGLKTGYGNGAFKVALVGEFIEKPGTLGTPGNYLP